MNPLVSVIVPIYKVEDYLERCVESLLNQTYSNFELILVDDGSPDRCPQICDKYAEKDERIRVIHKENGGLSDARNAGTQIAKGEYITFIDSDDWVLPEYIEVLLNLLIENEAQVSICCFQRVSKATDIEQDKEHVEKVFTKIEALKMLLYQRYYDNSAWAKLYKAELVKRHLYPKGKLFEDLGTTYKIFDECEKIAWSNRMLYCYFVNAESITQQKFSAKRLDIIDLVDEQFSFVKSKYPELYKAATSRKFSAYCYAFKQLKDQGIEWNKTREILWGFIKEQRISMLLDSEARLKNRLAAVCACMGKNVFSIF